MEDTLSDTFRQGVVVKPYERLNAEQIELLHGASLRILQDPGIWCYNRRAAELFQQNGATVREETAHETAFWRISIPPKVVTEAIASAPSRIVLGARNPENRLVLDAEIPRVYFGSGSEANIWLETDLEEYVSTSDDQKKVNYPRHTEVRGSTALLSRAAKLCDKLEHLDFFIRPVNIQDEGITTANHDANKFFASLNNITKHVQAGLTDLDRLPDVIRMAEIVAGGATELRENPVISFIACLFKSPLQLVDDTADKVFAIVEAGLPVVISSSPQGGSSAPIQEAGMVAQINAEILAGVTMTQLIKKGAPVIYGSVAVRARLDDLHDLYGCPEFNHYNADSVQLARKYKIPCYSSAGVGDAKVPGMQALYEKMLTHTYMAMTGAQYIHYAFGLLDRTNTFSPLQAVLDNEQVGKVKHGARQATIDEAKINDVLEMEQKVMASSHRLFTRHARKALHAGDVSEPYRFGSKEREDRVIENALAYLASLEAAPASHMDSKTVETIYQAVPGLLPALKQSS
jgi:trimethylamine--corrinoid protein Co-methyltransferase